MILNIAQKIKGRKNFLLLVTTILLLSLYPSFLSAQQLPKLTPRSVFSLVVCSPTNDYEGNYGHSALRLQDDSLRIDVAFNFGSYTNQQSFFFYKVLLGKAESSLEGEHFQKFADRYKKEGRGITEYYLNLSLDQKQLLWSHLNQLLIQGDRFYQFNAVFNNCTTQIRDELFSLFEWDTNYLYGFSSEMTYRTAFDTLPLQGPWQQLFLHLIIGRKSDIPISMYEAAFLPEQLIKLLTKVNSNGSSLILAKNEIFPPQQNKTTPSRIITIICSLALMLLILVLTYLQSEKGINLIGLDRFLLLISGISGCFLLSLSLFSDIILLSSNYNILWLLPTNLILCVILKSRDNNLWTIRILKFTYICLILYPIATLLLPQHTPIESYFLAGALFIRIHSYLFINKKQKKK